MRSTHYLDTSTDGKTDMNTKSLAPRFTFPSGVTYKPGSDTEANMNGIREIIAVKKERQSFVQGRFHILATELILLRESKAEFDRKLHNMCTKQTGLAQGQDRLHTKLEDAQIALAQAHGNKESINRQRRIELKTDREDRERDAPITLPVVPDAIVNTFPGISITTPTNNTPHITPATPTSRTRSLQETTAELEMVHGTISRKQAVIEACQAVLRQKQDEQQEKEEEIEYINRQIRLENKLIATVAAFANSRRRELSDCQESIQGLTQKWYGLVEEARKTDGDASNGSNGEDRSRNIGTNRIPSKL